MKLWSLKALLHHSNSPARLHSDCTRTLTIIGIWATAATGEGEWLNLDLPRRHAPTCGDVQLRLLIGLSSLISWTS